MKFFKLICGMIFVFSFFCIMTACNDSNNKHKIDVVGGASVEYETEVNEDGNSSWLERLKDSVYNMADLDYERIADRTFDEFVNALKNQDKAKFKSLFSNNAKNEAKTLDKDIEELFSFIKGDIISFSRTENTGIPAETTYVYGKEKKIISPCFTLETDEEKYYLGIEQCIMDDFDCDNEGIIYICIINAKDWKEDCFYIPCYENAFGIIID